MMMPSRSSEPSMVPAVTFSKRKNDRVTKRSLPHYEQATEIRKNLQSLHSVPRKGPHSLSSIAKQILPEAQAAARQVSVPIPFASSRQQRELKGQLMANNPIVFSTRYYDNMSATPPPFCRTSRDTCGMAPTHGSGILCPKR